MKWRRVIKVGAVALVCGAVFNALLAQALGWFMPELGREWVFHQELVGVVAGIDRAYVQLTPESRSGRRVLSWTLLGDSSPPHELRAFPVLVKRDPSGRVPGWCSVWDAERRAALRATAAARVDPVIERVVGPFDLGLGWPAVCFVASVDATIYNRSNRNRLTPIVRGGFATGFSGRAEAMRVLAWRPVLPGLIVGSLFWGGALLAMLAGMMWCRGALRRLFRRGRGRCKECGYDRRGLAADAVCPECGMAPATLHPPPGAVKGTACP